MYRCEDSSLRKIGVDRPAGAANRQTIGTSDVSAAVDQVEYRIGWRVRCFSMSPGHKGTCVAQNGLTEWSHRHLRKNMQEKHLNRFWLENFFK